MRILVNDIAASSGGAKSILLEFYRFLVESGDKNEWIFLLGEQLVEETENIHVILLPHIKKSWFRRLWFDCVSGRQLVKRIAPDVIFSMQNTAIFCGDMPQYIYVHQSIPFQTVKQFSLIKKTERVYAVYQYLIGSFIKWSVKYAQGIFVQTQWMKDAAEKYIAPEKILVVPPSVSVEEYMDRSPVPMQRNHFFYPANGAVYKNHEAIMEAVKLLIAEGITDFQVDLTLDASIDPAEKPAQITYVGTLPREVVMEKYRSSILLFPSYIETYGLPLAEARLMQGLILAADTPFAREILHGYQNAWFFDPFDPSQLKELMKKTITGEITLRHAEQTEMTQDNSWEQVVKHIVR